MSDATSSPYFYMAGDQRRGPFPYRELLDQPVHRQTPVWCKGMSDWRPAGDLPELVGLIPPPPPQIAADGEPAALPPPVKDDLKRYADGLYRLNFGIPALLLATLVMGSLTDTAFRFAYFVAALVWIALLWNAAVTVRAKWPSLWAMAGVLPVVSYVPLIVLHSRLKRPLITAGYRVGFFGRATPPAGVDT